MLALLFLVGALHAATLRVEAANEQVYVIVDGLGQGRTPLVLDLDDGRHAFEFKKEEWQVAAVRYSVLVDGETKGKMVVDWQTEEIKVVWAEDIVRAREAEQARIAAARQAEEDARRAEEAARRNAEEQRRILAEEAARAAAKERYMPHREVGVASMKEGDRRTALRAFREAVAVGDTDKRILALVQKLEGEIATVRVRVTGAKSGVPIQVTLDAEECEPFAHDSESRGRWIFEDVPAGVPLELRVSGPGYPGVMVPVPPLPAGQRKDLTAALEYFGSATLVLTDFPDNIRVTITDPAGEHSPREAGELAVTAGSIALELDGPSGVRQLELALADGDTMVFAVKDQMPGTVVLEGLPSGSEVALVDAPEGAKLSTTGTARDDQREVQDGVGIAAPLRLEGLLPGDYHVSIEHPVLGDTALRFSPLPGETSHQAILWETMSHATAVREARADWERRLALSKQVPKPTKLGWAAVGGTAALAAVSGVMGVRSLGLRADLDSNENSYNAALSDDDGQGAWDLYESQVQLQQSLRSSTGVTVGGLGLTAAGAGVSVVLLSKGRKLVKPVEDWDLWSLSATAPSIPAAPATDAPVAE
jgi:hypothetical protein